ncbi:hypothetical protein NPA08_03415 [Mycoplasmopsis citelli]|uniref:hypothetical protein n=1 Tax=Mycoplasmopsis citelli TaxID=171281 RepID=UPI0021154C49|nr:hypothetical protein [Mycoplasmopsis citelli]UUD35980.1 hypothetical protein NPA08_03415 [Mycoplasmopsis citelli]
MFGIYDRSFLKLNSVGELWNLEHKFRKFIVANGIAIFILFLTSVIASILMIVYRPDIISFYTNIAAKIYKEQEKVTASANSGWNSLFWSNIWPTLFLFIFGILFVRSAYTSYIEKNFMKLTTSNFVIFILLMVSFGWISNLSSLGKDVLNLPFVPIFSLLITNIILGIISVIFITWHVYLIKMSFARATRLEAIRAMSQEFSKFSQQNPFGFNYPPFNGANAEQATSDENQNQNPNYAQEEIKKPQDLEKDKQIQKLLELKTEQLYKMAEVLGIFGFKELSKEELAEKIYIYTRKKSYKA